MKKVSSILTCCLSFGLLASALLYNNKVAAVETKAEEQLIQTYAYDQMVILSSSISGRDITDVNSDPNALIDYGFRHGSVGTGNINMFDSFGDNRLGTDGNNAMFLNWRMQTGNGDAAIIKLTANKKVFVNISRAKLGFDWRNDITLSIYKDTQLLTSIELGDSTQTSDFTFDYVLEEGESLYWELLANTDAPRHISMGNAGDYTTLPTFKISEYVEYPNRSVSFGELVTNYTASNEDNFRDESNLFKYKFNYGSVENKSFNAPSKTSNSINLGNSLITKEGKFSIDADSSVILDIYTLNNVKLVLDWTEELTNYNNLKIEYFLTYSSKTKSAYNSDNFPGNYTLLGKNFVLSGSENLLIQITNKTNTKIENIDLLENLTFEVVPSNSSLKSDYPIYKPSDYSFKETITHKELAFETAKLRCEPIQLKDISVSLLTGTVTEDNGEDLNKFDTIKYDDGVYLYNANTQPSMILAGPNGTFNSDDQAVVEDYRLQTSISEGVVYKFVANKDTELKITHSAATGGWVGDGIYFQALQYNGKVTKSFFKEYVNDAHAPADTYAVTYNLKEGDVAYYVFGSEMALRRNINLAPVFTTNSANYSADAREEVFGPTVAEAFLYQTVTDTINNNYEPVTYEETLTVGLYHGTVEEKSLFKSHKGKGSGTEEDALIVGSGNDSDAGFQRWQFHAGLNNDNAIMEFKAERDMELTISHKSMGTLFYNTGSSLKYYAIDIDGFAEYLEERYLSNDTPDDFYGYQISLSKGQSLLIEFTANDLEGYAVASIEWVATANPKEYKSSEVNDFSDARELQTYKDGLVTQLNEYVGTLSPLDYSINNYSKIESYVSDFVTSIKKMSDKDKILELYNETLAKIDNVLTLFEEETLLQEAKDNAIKEAEEYINSKKASYTASEWTNVLNEFDSFKLTVSLETSITNINVLLIQFKTTIDAMPATQSTVNTVIIICCSVGGTLLLAAGITIPLIIKKKKTK